MRALAITLFVSAAMLRVALGEHSGPKIAVRGIGREVALAADNRASLVRTDADGPKGQPTFPGADDPSAGLGGGGPFGGSNLGDLQSLMNNFPK